MFVQNILILAHLRNVKQQILQSAVQLFSAYFCQSRHSQPPMSDTVKVKRSPKPVFPVNIRTLERRPFPRRCCESGLDGDRVCKEKMLQGKKGDRLCNAETCLHVPSEFMLAEEDTLPLQLLLGSATLY